VIWQADETIRPWFSGLGSFLAEDMKAEVPLKGQKYYETLGLRELDEAGRLNVTAIAGLVHADISPDHGFRRWAFIHPELRFRLLDASRLKFTAEFAIPEVTYKVTGPVTVSYAVNGRTLGVLRCSHPGDFHLETPLPDGLVEPDKPIRVTFEANPRWISPEDGAQLSFLLRSAGFIH